MVGTPTAARQVECGQPLLVLRRLRIISDYAVKIKSVLDHPTASILDDCWQNHYCVHAERREPFGDKVSKMFDEAQIDNIPTTQLTTQPWLRGTSVVNRKHLQPLYIKIRDHITDMWQDCWDYSDTGDFYRELQPVVSYKITTSNAAATKRCSAYQTPVWSRDTC